MNPDFPSRRLASLVVAASLLVACAGCQKGWQGFERDTLNPGVRSDVTPAGAGLTAEQVTIPSGERRLDGYVALAAEGCPARTPALLIYHGRNETAPDWFAVQRLLAERCVASMVFDYSGHGRSSPGGTISNLNADGRAAALYFSRRFASASRRCALGFSMGAAVALDTFSNPPGPIECLVLSGPFPSLRYMARLSGTPSVVTIFLSDEWNNVKAAREISTPLLWIQSVDDEIVPADASRQVFEAAPQPKKALMLQGLDHNAIHTKRPQQIWDPLVSFVQTGIP